MRIVITGGNGYIGARLSRYLADRGHEVIPICYPVIPENDIWKNKMSEIIVGDIRQDKLIEDIEKIKADVIIHLVSLDHFDSEKDPRFVNEINVLPTWQLLNACTKNGLKKFIYFSTIHVYGKLECTLINENYPIRTGNAYGLTHFLSERLCDHYNRNTDTNVISVRLSNSYGTPIFAGNNCWWLAINDLCKKAYTQKEIRLLSDGSPQRDFIHGNDVCQAISRLIDSDIKHIDNNIYHISSGETLTILELARTIQEVYRIKFGELLPIITPNGVVPDIDETPVVKRYKISNEKLKALKFLPIYTLRKGINELFEYFESN